MLRGFFLCVIFLTGTAWAEGPPPVLLSTTLRGAGEIPAQLPGPWWVSVCASTSHAWIRYEHAQTGEVHTISRFGKGFGGQRDPITREWVVPRVPFGGLWWDQDLRFEDGVRTGKFLKISTLVHNPKIYTGSGEVGYRLIHDNCTSYVAEAWCFYSGEDYGLDPVLFPRRFIDAVRRRHPQVPPVVRAD